MTCFHQWNEFCWFLDRIKGKVYTFLRPPSGSVPWQSPSRTIQVNRCIRFGRSQLADDWSVSLWSSAYLSTSPSQLSLQSFFSHRATSPFPCYPSGSFLPLNLLLLLVLRFHIPANKLFPWPRDFSPLLAFCSTLLMFSTFWLRNMLPATKACDFSTSELLKVVWACCYLYILTVSFAPQLRAIFSTFELPKMVWDRRCF